MIPSDQVSPPPTPVCLAPSLLDSSEGSSLLRSLSHPLPSCCIPNFRASPAACALLFGWVFNTNSRIELCLLFSCLSPSWEWVSWGLLPFLPGIWTQASLRWAQACTFLPCYTLPLLRSHMQFRIHFSRFFLCLFFCCYSFILLLFFLWNCFNNCVLLGTQHLSFSVFSCSLSFHTYSLSPLGSKDWEFSALSFPPWEMVDLGLWGRQASLFRLSLGKFLHFLSLCFCICAMRQVVILTSESDCEDGLG